MCLCVSPHVCESAEASGDASQGHTHACAAAGKRATDSSRPAADTALACVTRVTRAETCKVISLQNLILGISLANGRHSANTYYLYSIRLRSLLIACQSTYFFPSTLKNFMACLIFACRVGYLPAFSSHHLCTCCGMLPGKEKGGFRGALCAAASTAQTVISGASRNNAGKWPFCEIGL